LETRQTLISLGKICLAGAALALVCWLANYWWLDAWASLRFFSEVSHIAHRDWISGNLIFRSRLLAADKRGAGHNGCFPAAISLAVVEAFVTNA